MPKPTNLIPDVQVSTPDHYDLPMQPIIFIMKNKFDYITGNIIKYASRAGRKTYDGMTREESEIRDLLKIIDYAQKRIREIRGEPIV